MQFAPMKTNLQTYASEEVPSNTNNNTYGEVQK